MIFLYRLVYPVFILFLLPFSIFSPKIRRGFIGRIQAVTKLHSVSLGWADDCPRFWFHFSSAGEFEQTLPFLNSLKKQCSQAVIVLTYFSPSGERAVELERARCSNDKRLPPWDVATYSPFDFVWTVKRFIRSIQATAFVSINKELWPETLYQLSKNKTPCFLFAGSFGSVSSKLLFWYRWLLPYFGNITTINSESTLFCEQLTGIRPNIQGEPRVERILQRVHSSSGALSWTSFFDEQRVLIGASLWEEDLRVLVNCLPQLLMEFKDFRLILVPHEPNPARVKKWKQILKTNGIETRLWSHWLKSPDLVSHLLVDQVGILAELYSVGSTVFVGGSFKKKVHNVLEPFFNGCSLVTGPFIRNSSEALELQKLGLLSVCKDESNLLVELRTLLASKQDKKVLKQQALTVFEKHQKVSEAGVQLLISKCLNEKQPISSTQTET